MKNVACIALMGALGLFGCGDDDGGAVDPGNDASRVDSGGGGGGVNAGLPPAACNVVSQAGCDEGEKCGYVLIDSDLGVGGAACAPDGTQALGATCTPPTTAGASDDCAGGGWCFSGECKEICATPGGEGCSEGTTCQMITDVNNLGACLAGCDLVAQNCGTDGGGTALGCFVTSSGAACAPAFPSDMFPTDTTCTSANGCPIGYGCLGGNCLSFCGNAEVCYGEDGLPNACGTCNDMLTRGCGALEVCYPFLEADNETPTFPESGAGYCVAGEELAVGGVACDCNNAPNVCPTPTPFAPSAPAKLEGPAAGLMQLNLSR